MSDVLAWKGDKGVLLTGLTNPQVVRTAEVVGDVKCIVLFEESVPVQRPSSWRRKPALY